MEPEKSTQECECRVCGDSFSGEVLTYGNFHPPREIRAGYCPKCAAARDAEEKVRQDAEIEELRGQAKAAWHRLCGIPAYLQGRTFANFDGQRQRRALSLCQKYAEGFDLDAPQGYQSLILYSEVPGVGKTHLMVAIGNQVIDSWQGVPRESTTSGRSPIIFASGPQLVRRVRSTYNLTGEQSYHEREEDVYREVTGARLLMLDDVGKETPSRFTRELYWYIIDERVKFGLPVIISSRLPLEGGHSLEQLMGEDTVDRLYGMARGRFETLEGPSYRRTQATP